MKSLKIALVAAAAATLLSGCCGFGCKAKCYPYPLYDYSPARICSGAPCPAPCPAPACPVAPVCK